MFVLLFPLCVLSLYQVKRLSPESRLRFAALITALAADCGTPSDKARVAQALYNIGQRTKHNSQAVLYSTAKLVYDANDPELMNGKHVQLVLDEMQARDPVCSSQTVHVQCFSLYFVLSGIWCDCVGITGFM